MDSSSFVYIIVCLFAFMKAAIYQQLLGGALLVPFVLHFILSPYLKWRKEKAIPLAEVAEKSTIPAKRKTVRLSVVVPAYNEIDRMPIMMKETLDYLKARSKKDSKFTWEIIVVDDHSRDATFDTAASFNTDSTPVYALRLRKNAGKGGAVRVGALHAFGEIILMVDADGATRFSDLEKLEKQYNPDSGVEVVFGSREHLRRAEASQQRNPLRKILMFFFHVAVLSIIGTPIKDTQCGFKLFSKRTSKILFQSLHLERWAFDTEIVLLCQLLGFKVAEVDVDWREIEGSKLNVLVASIQMLRDMVLLRLMYLLHIWVPNLSQ